ncbi:Rmf/CrpP fold protein [Streptomyces jeddahensis]|uniref:Ribosome modulation factor n=1 Tax=Streptomyces jeddahensis TaxID=1716141 RepID=A0A177HU63_9ACTN|nr:Rmf/CrpP fold protein [Streptomyces jeddahensis]OAH14266.1 ribosome modulation factor [Streptomyces jeddahensis]
MGTREDITRATTAGREAGRNGEPPTACPYPRTSLLRTAWIRGYAEARPVAARPEMPR